MESAIYVVAALPSCAGALLLQRLTGAVSLRRTATALLLGMLATLTVVPAVRVATSAVAGIDDPWGKLLLFAFLAAALPEETAKFAAFGLVAAPFRRRRSVVLGAVVGLGFAATENSLYTSAAGLGVGFLRTLTVVPCHALLGATMGLLAARSRTWGIALALVVPIALHFLYDALLLTAALARRPDLRVAAGFLVAVLLIGTATVVVRPATLRPSVEIRMRRGRIFRILGLGLIAMAIYLASAVAPYLLDPTTGAPERSASAIIAWGAAACVLFGAGLVLRGWRQGHREILDAREGGTYVRRAEPESARRLDE